ncbi:intersectin-1 isoform X2 [Anoplophora glabripennis]|uniref:intersectin-1 isoform X2 n=2 Tax=Anoplophora glabripennis TaxID=217634 RepID=UPI000875A2CF|nr:intersectin-1 isoform X2 [Anoplophora glabripennis]
MSAAGTPSTDPWVIVARERARYEEQFKSLKPNNGIITGEQAKGFFLQSQLPPLILGQIWALADTDADGRMDINEFSIACKLINLKLRGFEVPKGLPPSLLASLKVNTPPSIPPLPNSSSLPPRPEPPKIAPIISQSLTHNPPLIPSQPLLTQAPTTQPLVPNISPGLVSQAHIMGISKPVGSSTVVGGLPTGVLPPTSSIITTGGISASIPTGIVPPMQTNIQPVQPLISGLPTMASVAPLTGHSAGFGAPLVTASMVSSATVPLPSASPLLPGLAPTVSSFTSGSPLITGGPIISTTPLPNIPAAPVVPTSMSSVNMQTAVHPVGPGATSTPRASVTSLDRTHSIDSVSQTEWAVPHPTKLKYTQIFNTTDRARSGYLSGAQARNVMVQTKLPQNILAQIWALSDMDSDGRLGCEEFVLAMHLCEQASLGTPPPAKLPPDLIPPSFRKNARTASISSQGSVATEQDPASTLLQNSFEDKRKENFEKGQAELERRRKTLLDQQRQEREERERKEREEQEKKEKARQEAERKRLEELEKQMREQQEKERLLEEDRKRQAEQREAARKEMERQRQLEWEKQRLQDLQQQRQREQENVLKLKAKNQSLTIELSSLNDQVKELSQKICDTRLGVSNVKTTIDGMRSTRDSQMQEMSQLKNKLKEQNAKLLALSQEKVKLEAKNKINAQLSGQDAEQSRLAFENKEITIKNLKKKIEDMQTEINGKLSDIDNNNSQLAELQNQLKSLVAECEQLYGVYDQKRNTVLEMKNANRTSGFDAWKTTDAWGSSATEAAVEWPVDNWATSTEPTEPIETAAMPGIVKYRALYEFLARNNDEISFQPGDIINVPTEQTGEPGWLAGEIRGHTGWFPESYVEPVDGVGVRDMGMVGSDVTYNQSGVMYPEDTEATRLEGIAEVPEVSEAVSTNAKTNQVEEPLTIPNVTALEGEPEYYISNYPYQSQEQGDLTFNAGEVIAVYKKEGDWWTGKIGDNVGIFPSNYVQKVDVTSSATNNAAPPEPASTGVSAEAVQTALENVNAQADNEVSQINQSKTKEVPLDAAIQAGAQVVKSKKPEIASVIAPYESTSPEQLSLARGQLIMIRKKTDSGWWEGELQAKGRKRQVGWFPASYVKVLNSSGKISGRNTPVSTTRMQQEVVIDKVIALYPYAAGNPDELTFAKDDIISVTAREEEAWWRGELNGVSGLFPSNYVAPLQQQWQLTQDRKRQECINEFIQTEKTYVHDMSVVHEVFEVPLRKSKLVSDTDVDNIFVNWQDILQCNKYFLTDLLNNYNAENDTVGQIICRHLPLMTAYITFCGKQLDSATLLQKLTENSTAFRELVKKCQNNVATKGMPLSSFLIKPMQRITRYPLLISKIMENTPTDHLDFKYLEEALHIAEKFLNSVNENVRLKENQERMDWLQQCVQSDLNIIFNSNTNRLGPRQILHFGILIKVKNSKELLGFLFNDFFLLVQPNRSIGPQFTFQRNSNISYKMYKQPFLIQHLSVHRESTDTVENGTDSNRVLNMYDERNNYKIALLTSTVHECSLWLKKIESAKETHAKVISISRHGKRKTQPQMGPTCGRLLVLVQKGKRFISSGKSHNENIYCKVTLGPQEQQTDIAKENINNGNIPQSGIPQIPSLVWNYSMQFQLRNINQEVLTFVVLEQNPFAPDEFLGRAELKLKDILKESQNHNGPITKKLILHQVESGELVVKLDLHLFNSY